MANDIILLSGGAADGLVSSLKAAFQSETGAAVRGTFGAVGAMRERLKTGEAADLLILTRPIIDDLAQTGVVIPDSVTDIGVVLTAIAVRTGDPIPTVGTSDDLRKALIASDEIHFPDPALATAGIHFAKILNRLGLSEQKASALRTHPNGATAMRALAASGAAAPIGCTQVTEIIITPGAHLVAPLPGDLGLATIYTAAVVQSSQNASLARAFIDRLAGSQFAEDRRKAGFV